MLVVIVSMTRVYLDTRQSRPWYRGLQSLACWLEIVRLILKYCWYKITSDLII